MWTFQIWRLFEARILSKCKIATTLLKILTHKSPSSIGMLRSQTRKAELVTFLTGKPYFLTSDVNHILPSSTISYQKSETSRFRWPIMLTVLPSSCDPLICLEENFNYILWSSQIEIKKLALSLMCKPVTYSYIHALRCRYIIFDKASTIWQTSMKKSVWSKVLASTIRDACTFID